jgi:phosphate transport system permease protein
MREQLRSVLSINDVKRKVTNTLMIALIVLASLIAIFPLMSVFIFVFKKGFPTLSMTFFTHLPAAVSEVGGGMGQSLLGSSLLISIATLIGVPWGIASGIYITEYGHGKSAWFLRFSNDLLMGVPSIVVGLFVYSFVVAPMKGFSLIAGSLALGIIMIPIVSRSTEEILKTVPVHIREAGLALGIPRWKVILNIILRGSWGGILTGVILSVARISGETAPLLFTSFNNQFWSTSLTQPISSLPVQIYTYAISPFEDWQKQAWAGALVLILFIFAINIFVRFIFNKRTR